MRNIYFLGCGHFSNTMVVLRNISVRRLNIPSFCFHSLPLLLLPSKLAVTVDKMSLGKTVIESIKSPMVRSMVEFAMESIWQVGFSRSLGCYGGMQVKSVVEREGSTELVYQVPEKLCISGGQIARGGRKGNDGAYLPCGVILALFDEVSTLAMTIADRKCRPGVSVSLSCETYHPVGPGEKVTFTSRALKMGVRMGFGEASMYREDGKLAARGRHVKFLPMGTAWDLSFTRLLFPFARMLFKYHHQRLAQDPERTKGLSSDEHLMDIFRLEELEVIESMKNEDSWEPSTSKTERKKLDGGDITRAAEAEVKVTKRHINYKPGSLHGGAVAICAEEIARRCPPWSPPKSLTETTEAPRVRFMEVHYMSAIKRRAYLAAVSTAVKGADDGVTRVGISEGGGAGGGRLCAEAVLLWGPGGK